MPIPIKYLAELEPDETYHIYNRTNNKEKLFRSEYDYAIFIKTFEELMLPFLGIYSYNLLPNHFHFLVKIKSEQEITEYLLKAPDLKFFERKFLEGKITFDDLISRAFKRFFVTYAIGFNERHERKGNLFYRPFKRVKVQSGAHFTQLIVYIHANDLKHQLAKDFGNYPWSSWKDLLHNNDCNLLKNDLIKWFGSYDLLIKAHYDMSEFYYETEAGIEY